MEEINTRIRCGHLIRDISNDRELSKISIMNELDKYNSNINTLVHYYPYLNNHFMLYVNISPSEDHMIGSIKLDYDEFRRSLLEQLDCKFTYKEVKKLSEEEFENIVKNRINTLKSLDNKNSIKSNFPSLYQKYLIAKPKFDDIEKKERMNAKNPDFEDIKERSKKDRNYLFNRGMKRKLYGISDVKDGSLIRVVPQSSYCHCQADYFERLLKHRSTIKKLCESYEISKDFLNGLDNDKLNLYMFYCYLNTINNSNNKEKNKTILKLLENNIHYIENNNNEIIIDNKTINKEYLLYYFAKFYKENFGRRNIKLDRDFMSKSKVDRNHSNDLKPIKILTDDEREILINYNKELIDYYNSKGIICVIDESFGFTGQHAFVTEYGDIVTDYIAPTNEDSDLKKLKGVGIYHFNIENFEKYLGMERLTVRKELSKEMDGRTFTTHKGDWQGRVDEMLNTQEKTDENKEKTNKFLDDMEKKYTLKR